PEATGSRSRGTVRAQAWTHSCDGRSSRYQGPMSNRRGFDEIGAAVAGLFALEGTLSRPKQPATIPICDNVVGWLGTTGVLAAPRRRAIEGGSYRVVISLTRTVLWLLSLGIFDRTYAQGFNGRTQLCRTRSLHGRDAAPGHLSGHDRTRCSCRVHRVPLECR